MNKREKIKETVRFLIFNVAPCLLLVISSWYIMALGFMVLPFVMKLTTDYINGGFQFIGIDLLPLWFFLTFISISIYVFFKGIAYIRPGGEAS